MTIFRETLHICNAISVQYKKTRFDFGFIGKPRQLLDVEM